MSRWPFVRFALGLAALVLVLLWIQHNKVDTTQANLYIAEMICVVTAVYVLITFEIFLQNHAMAKAATDSTKLMEQTLRFSFSPNLQYKTINTKDPRFAAAKDLLPIQNEVYRTAISNANDGGQQKEYVFAIIKNVGRGAATNLRIQATYDIRDNSRAPKNSKVETDEKVQLLEEGKGVAACIYVYNVPVAGDYVSLESAFLSASDFYLDVRKESPAIIRIEPKNHDVEEEADSTVRVR